MLIGDKLNKFGGTVRYEGHCCNCGRELYTALTLAATLGVHVYDGYDQDDGYEWLPEGVNYAACFECTNDRAVYERILKDAEHRKDPNYPRLSVYLIGDCQVWDTRSSMPWARFEVRHASTGTLLEHFKEKHAACDFAAEHSDMRPVSA